MCVSVGLFMGSAVSRGQKRLLDPQSCLGVGNQTVRTVVLLLSNHWAIFPMCVSQTWSVFVAITEYHRMNNL